MKKEIKNKVNQIIDFLTKPGVNTIPFAEDMKIKFKCPICGSESEENSFCGDCNDWKMD